MESRPKSLSEVAARVSRGGSFSMELADFLDEFRELPGEDAFVEEPPLLGSSAPERRWIDAYFAAVAEHLCGRHELRRPSWLKGAARYLKDPSFACRSRAGRLFLLKDSPAAFKSRNLFVSANALERV
jgi:hypothetical protein